MFDLLVYSFVCQPVANHSISFFFWSRSGISDSASGKAGDSDSNTVATVAAEVEAEAVLATAAVMQ